MRQPKIILRFYRPQEAPKKVHCSIFWIKHRQQWGEDYFENGSHLLWWISFESSEDRMPFKPYWMRIYGLEFRSYCDRFMIWSDYQPNWDRRRFLLESF